MALPKYNELYTLFLAAVQDGKVHGMAEIRAEIAQKLHLTQDELEQKLSSGKQTVFSNRVGWAKTYLKKAGLLHSPKRGSFQISEEGYRLLTSGEDITNDLLCGRYSDFAEFWASRQVANPSKKAGRRIRQAGQMGKAWASRKQPRPRRKRWIVFTGLSTSSLRRICWKRLWNNPRLFLKILWWI